MERPILFLCLWVMLTIGHVEIANAKHHHHQRHDHTKGHRHHHKHHGPHTKRQTDKKDDIGIIPVDYCDLLAYDRYTNSCISTFMYPNTTEVMRQQMHWQNRWLLTKFQKHAIEDANRPDITPVAGFLFLNVSASIYKRLCDNYFVPYNYISTAEYLFRELHYATTADIPRRELISQKDTDRTVAILMQCLNRTKGQNYTADSCGEKIFTDEADERVCPNLPTDFNGDLYDPLLDTIWHIYETIHSYCFPDFQNDNRMWHIYAYGVLDLFHRDIVTRWPRMNETEEFWERLLGPTWRRIGRNMELCTGDVIRHSEKFPYRMGRETIPAQVRMTGFTGVET